MGAEERQQDAVVMAVVLVYPIESAKRVYAVLGPHLRHELEFEDVRVACIAPGHIMVLDTMISNGLPANVIGFMNSKACKTMWREMIRFDAIGTRIDVGETWAVVEDLVLITHQKLVNSIDSVTIEDYSRNLLLQYATALSGPSFCENQDEYGKRYMLNKFLSE